MRLGDTPSTNPGPSYSTQVQPISAGRCASLPATAARPRCEASSRLRRLLSAVSRALKLSTASDSASTSLTNASGRWSSLRKIPLPRRKGCGSTTRAPWSRIASSRGRMRRSAIISRNPTPMTWEPSAQVNSHPTITRSAAGAAAASFTAPSTVSWSVTQTTSSRAASARSITSAVPVPQSYEAQVWR